MGLCPERVAILSACMEVMKQRQEGSKDQEQQHLAPERDLAILAQAGSPRGLLFRPDGSARVSHEGAEDEGEDTLEVEEDVG